jgi:hypothetical protein
MTEKKRVIKEARFFNIQKKQSFMRSASGCR